MRTLKSRRLLLCITAVLAAGAFATTASLAELPKPTVKPPAVNLKDKKFQRVVRVFPRPKSIVAPGVTLSPHTAPALSVRLGPVLTKPSPWRLNPGGIATIPGVKGPQFRWDFEHTLDGWTASLPRATVTCGRLDPTFLAAGNKLPTEIGGDYWKGTYWPGQSGECMLATGDQTMTFTSPVFKIGADSRYVSYLSGTGHNGARSTVTIQLLDDVTTTRTERKTKCTPTMPPVCHDVDETTTTTIKPSVRDEGNAAPGLSRHIQQMREEWYGKRAQIIVSGQGGGGILIDDVMGTAAPPPATPGPVWGFADLHNHLFNHLGFGGRIFSGKPFAPGGMPEALKECQDNHGNSPCNGVMSVTPDMDHERHGFPTFDGWPRSWTMTHQQVYIDWLKRAWAGGLRLVQVDVGNSEFVARGFAINQWLGNNLNPLPTDDVSTIERELDAAWEFVRGPGLGWAEIAQTAAEARRIASAGKLALVLGIEVDAIGNHFADCSSSRSPTSTLQGFGNPSCNTLPADPRALRTEIKNLLNHLYGRGVRHIIPVHLLENAYGYPAVYGRILDVTSQTAG